MQTYQVQSLNYQIDYVPITTQEYAVNAPTPKRIRLVKTPFVHANSRVVEICTLVISMFGVVRILSSKPRKSGYITDDYTPMLNTACCLLEIWIVIFPCKISNRSGDISLFKLGSFKHWFHNTQYYIWDILDIDWSQIKVLINNIPILVLCK